MLTTKLEPGKAASSRGTPKFFFLVGLLATETASIARPIHT